VFRVGAFAALTPAHRQRHGVDRAAYGVVVCVESDDLCRVELADAETGGLEMVEATASLMFGLSR
jgi:hypothetical protein